VRDGWIALLGGHELNAGIAEVARRRNLGLVVVDWNERPAVAGDVHLRVDIKDAEAVLGALSPYRDDLRLAYSSADVATDSVAAVHAERGWQRPTRDALVRARDKHAMTLAWERDGLLGKSYRLCETEEELQEFRVRVPRDIIVKPVAGSSSRGVTRVRRSDGADVLRTAWERATAYDPPLALAEEFVTGTEFTVEMVGDRGGNVQVWAVSRKYHTAFSGANLIATKLHYNPPDVDKGRQARIADFGRRCFLSLGLAASLGHFEVMERADGSLVPVEMAARSSGFIVSHLADAAMRRDRPMLDVYADVLHGASVPDETLSSDWSSMFFFYDLPPGVANGPSRHLLEFLDGSVESLAHERGRLERGRRFGAIDSDAERHGYEILTGPRAELTIERVEEAEHHLAGVPGVVLVPRTGVDEA